jgi:hypothetical protein
MSAISHRFRFEILKRRATGVRVWQIAESAGVSANWLSGICGGSLRPRRDDARVGRVGAVLGLTLEECFESAVASAEAVAS